MPNWVKSNISVYSNSEDREKVKQEIKRFSRNILTPSFSLAHVIPPPDTEEYKTEGWYKWNNKNWGTKWDVSGCEIDLGGMFCGSLSFTFRTAWSFPFPVFDVLGRMYPRLIIHAEFADEDIGSNCGEITYHDLREDFTDRDGDIDFARSVWNYEDDEYDEEDGD